MADATKKPRNVFIVWACVGLVGLLVALVGWSTHRANTAWLADVRTYAWPAGVHIEATIDYEETPAAGGPHDPVWQNCGTYSMPIREEHAVHSMEHGAVWITYDPERVDGESVAMLTSVHGANPYVLISPYPGLSSPLVVSAWNRQLDIAGVDDDRLILFVDMFAGGAQAPEPGGPCTGGTDATAAGQSVAGDPTASAPGGTEVTDEQAQRLVGMSETQATAAAQEKGWVLRIGSRDGEYFMLTEDYRTDRVTVDVVDGTVTAVAVG